MVERVLVDAVILARLMHRHAATVAAVASVHPAVTACRERRLTTAQHRLVSALKAWEAHAAKREKGARPTLKLFAAARATGS